MQATAKLTFSFACLFYKEGVQHGIRSYMPLFQDELLERALSTSSMSGSLYESVRLHTGTTTLIENLESQVCA